eukprot:1411482-Prorocentrum_lima.AAC.1
MIDAVFETEMTIKTSQSATALSTDTTLKMRGRRRGAKHRRQHWTGISKRGVESMRLDETK